MRKKKKGEKKIMRKKKKQIKNALQNFTIVY